MKDFIKAKITDYILNNKDNWNIETNDRIFDEPIVKFASADDKIFEEYKTVAPGDSEWFQKLISKKVGPSSKWSERHVAYAAGLGTFSLNEGFISEKGHDKLKCYKRAYVEAFNKFGVSQCSLCQTNVPCEYKNPIT